ncbi:uncharacterized protein LOC117171844 [Belonocnema kinseyi]|uniref:uncharacterized protein LOC117171844 n=1 Tax=Belonocnema kinseyi TaxID=2817044 RepID=UPI00143D7561|nr:uncharacterized protein LOC117171844 [Belonocnema kinseyi]
MNGAQIGNPSHVYVYFHLERLRPPAYTPSTTKHQPPGNSYASYSTTNRFSWHVSSKTGHPAVQKASSESTPNGQYSRTGSIFHQRSTFPSFMFAVIRSWISHQVTSIFDAAVCYGYTYGFEIQANSIRRNFLYMDANIGCTFGRSTTKVATRG